MKRFGLFSWIFGRHDKQGEMIAPGVRVVEHEMPHRVVVDVDPAIGGSDVAALSIVELNGESRHVEVPRFIGPKMRRPRWWQFWRRRRWRRECDEARSNLLRWWGGAPLVMADPPSAELIAQYLLHDSEQPFEVVRVEPTEDGAVSLTLRERQHGMPGWIEKAMERKQELIDELREESDGE